MRQGGPLKKKKKKNLHFQEVKGEKKKVKTKKIYMSSTVQSVELSVVVVL